MGFGRLLTSATSTVKIVVVAVPTNYQIEPSQIEDAGPREGAFSLLDWQVLRVGR